MGADTERVLEQMRGADMESELELLQQIQLMLAAIIEAGRQINRLLTGVTILAVVSIAQIGFMAWLILGEHLK